MLKLATAGTETDLRGLVAEFYFTQPDRITLANGEIWKNGEKMATNYAKKGARWVFYKKGA